MQFSLLSLAVLAGAAVATPLAAELQIEQRAAAADNCTQYTSVSAGSVCIHRPSDCTATYLVQPDDTCGSIGALYNNFTLSILQYWNPDIGKTCFGLQAYVPVCINTPWYTFTPPVQEPEGTVEADTSNPIPQMPNIVSNCNSFELAGGGYTVDTIVASNNISEDNFLDWNPYINKTAPVAWEGYWVCVGVV
ncbi:LysM domain-containing protein [Lachnellula occidentalis]|uniref:LysM domain-containing protein n=1 Tax=Lachnellula occidentalis TaxID=215460 RepID=A0A8H8S1R2_9HELO|nr:LysM domain-containing protein [Lachnellula occidentalis]